tara:strand:+ start:234 stop:806 length:573 start_codon:yes stop_codon:yes gene_type:complete
MDNRFKSLNIKEIFVFTPKKFEDERGLFYENFNNKDFLDATNFTFNTVQENISYSRKHTLRGLHFQRGKFSQSKIISVLKGSILDVVVDIRADSKTFSKWVSYILDDKLNESIFVPHGFAHGFLALEDYTKVSYKVDKPYNKKSECSIIWNDPNLMIDWSVNNPILSKKDSEAFSLEKIYNLKNFSLKEI